MLNTNSYLIVGVKGYISKFISKCHKNDICLYSIEYKNEDSMIVKIKVGDFLKIKKLNYYSEFKIIGYEGFDYYKYHFKNNMYVYLMAIFCFLLMDVITSYIVDIKIIHENSNIRELLSDELSNHNIKKKSLAYSFDNLESIKNTIIKDNPESLEWMSITRVGMTYIVRAEERIIKNTEVETGYRHIVSSKDALVTKIIGTKGEVLVRSGDYVKKDDILISGSIKLYEDVKGNTLATGDVYGDVWYTAEINHPISYTEKEYTGKSRINFIINNKILLKNKYQYFSQDNIRELQLLFFKVQIYKESEYIIREKLLTEEEAEKEALKKLDKEINIKLNKKGKIITKKVLKKDIINSTMNMRVFIVTNELISDYLYYEVGRD